MFPNRSDFIFAQERHKDLRREAERERLVNQVRRAKDSSHEQTQRKPQQNASPLWARVRFLS